MKNSGYVTIIFIALTMFVTIARGQNDGNYLTLHATVLNKKGDAVSNLKKEYFSVYDEKSPKKIVDFSTEQEAMSIGFLIDDSGSMGKFVSYIRNGILQFLDISSNRNEYSVVTFNKKINIIQDFTNEAESVKKTIGDNSKFQGNGMTRLNDAVYATLGKLAKGSHPKKVLIIATDSEDTESLLFNFKDVRRAVEDSGILIYIVTMYDESIYPINPNPRVGEEAGTRGSRNLPQKAKPKMNGVSQLSGGKTFYVKEGRLPPGNSNDAFQEEPISTTEAFTRIAAILKSQYKIKFDTGKAAEKNKWHTIEIKLEIPENERKKLGSPTVIARKGYYPISYFVSSEKD
jgi:VWFA-related protein